MHFLFFLPALYAAYQYIIEEDHLSTLYLCGMFFGFLDLCWFFAFGGDLIHLSIGYPDTFDQLMAEGAYSPLLWRAAGRALLIGGASGFMYYRRLYIRDIRPILPKGR